MFPRTLLQTLAQSNAALGGSGGAREQGGFGQASHVELWKEITCQAAPRRPGNPVRGPAAAQCGWEGPASFPGPPAAAPWPG